MNNNQPDSKIPTAQLGVVERLAARSPSIIDVMRHHMPAGHLHEVFSAHACDIASAAAFAQILVAQFLLHRTPDAMEQPLAAQAIRRGPCFWVQQISGVKQAILHPPGMAEMGFELEGCYQVHAASPLAALRAAADIARCGGIGAVLVQIEGNPRILDLTATRRLALAAEKNNAPVILLRSDATPMPSAAYSRWQIKSAASTALSANAPGLPTFAAELLRHRKFMAGISAVLEWDAHGRTMREVKMNAHYDLKSINQSIPQDEPPTKIFGSVSALPARQPDRTRWQSAA